LTVANNFSLALDAVRWEESIPLCRRRRRIDRVFAGTTIPTGIGVGFDFAAGAVVPVRTINRDIEYMRLHMGAPITYDVQVLDDEGKLVFDTAAAQSALELIASFSDSGITRPDMIGLDGNIMHGDVATAESVLFYQGGTWNWANWARSPPSRCWNRYCTNATPVCARPV